MRGHNALIKIIKLQGVRKQYGGQNGFVKAQLGQKPMVTKSGSNGAKTIGVSGFECCNLRRGLPGGKGGSGSDVIAAEGVVEPRKQACRPRLGYKIEPRSCWLN